MSIAYLGRSKTIQLLANRYYWKGLTNSVVRYVRNCYTCKRANAPRDCILGLLQPLPILERLQKHITIDYQSLPKDAYSYNIVFVVVDRLSKQSISILYFKNTIAKNIACLYIEYIYCTQGPLDSIVSNYRLQFVFAFQKEFY